jgi:6-phosphofructokinase 1
MSTDFKIKSLGTPMIDSPVGMDNIGGFQEDSVRTFINVTTRDRPTNALSFEMAGPRSKIYFEPSKTRVGIVTCGGLCPGLNNIIRNIVMQLTYNYGVNQIIGFQYGYQGFIPSYGHPIIPLTPERVKGIHHMGGSMLSSSRGEQSVEEIVDCLVRQNVNILFCIGGDGTLRGAHDIHEVITRRKLKISIIGLPKTIDNDIMYCAKTFGFETAFSEAVDSIRAAHVEAYGAPNGIVLVKLMGRDSGFIAANSVLACPDVNFVLVPEVRFELEGENGLFPTVERYLLSKRSKAAHPHAVIVVAEGAGQYFFEDNRGTDASGNRKYADIGIFLRDKMKEYFKPRMEVNLKYIEPSYLIRSVPANAHDAIFCHHLAENAAHAGMAGKTDMMIGFWNGNFTHVPFTAVIQGRKKIDPNSEFWRQVLQTTGQPANMV